MIAFVSFTVLLWVLFIIFANLKEKAMPKVKGTVGEVPVMWVFTIFGIVDIFYNFTFATIAFMQLPSFKQLTLTARLKHILHVQDMGWRWKLADFVCRRLIEPWDYNHCGLADL